MHAEGLLGQTLIYLAAMVVTVPLARKAGLGAVLGYLIAGSALGPSALGWLPGGGDAQHVAEFGVTMMLFLIGLELRPAVLWKLRAPIFGMGGLQVLLTTLAVAAVAASIVADAKTALAIGMILSLSSTAIVLQSLQERGLAKRTGGEAAFSVLLFQDIAVIPILALLPFLSLLPAPAALSSSMGAPAAGGAWIQMAKIAGAVVIVVGAGKYLLHPVFRAVATAKLRELFTAVALLLVLATSALMLQAGLSPALGAFLAGVVLADSEYRHQLVTDIEPFKGLLLGVFFISVGAGIDFAQVLRQPGLTAAVVLGIVAIKWLVLFALGRSFRMSRPDALLLAFSLSQGGEFAFVLLNFSLQNGVLTQDASQLLTAAVALSMATAPLLIAFYAKQVEPRLASAAQGAKEPDTIDERDAEVIVAGIGRFGQTVARLLRATGHRVTVLDFDADQVELLRKFGAKSFFGDASDMDLLHAAGAENARILAIAIDDFEATLRMADQVGRRYPHLRILARAYDRIHAYKLIHRGVSDVYVETSGSALSMGTDALKILGMPARQALRAATLFKRNNDHSIQQLASAYHEEDEATFVNQARSWLEQLEKMLRTDLDDLKEQEEQGWEPAPRVD